MANSPSWKLLCQIPLAGLDQAAHRSQDAATVDAIANGESAAHLEQVPETGKVGDIGNEFLAVAQILILSACKPSRFGAMLDFSASEMAMSVRTWTGAGSDLPNLAIAITDAMATQLFPDMHVD
jgi:hypothetical protein